MGAEQTVRIDEPHIYGAYIYSADSITNVATANNYISLFNPVSSPRIIIVGGIFISSTLLTSSSITSSMRGWRTTAASGGTLQPASVTAKLQGHYPDSLGEIRTGNPTCTLGAPLFNSPAPITDKAAPVHEVEIPPSAPAFTLTPGSGIVLRTAAGIGVGATWNLSIAWAEI